MSFVKYIESSIQVLASIGNEQYMGACNECVELIANAVNNDKPLLVCGNGGSASDAMHITGELIGRFLKERRSLNAICLAANPAVLTAWSNDYSYDTVFARQVEAYGVPGSVVLGISTSGNSVNVLMAMQAARSKGLRTIALTGAGGGRLAGVADVLIAVPSHETPLVQQAHTCIYHYICMGVEQRAISR